MRLVDDTLMVGVKLLWYGCAVVGLVMISLLAEVREW